MKLAVDKHYFSKPVSAAPLVTFRIAFGLLMLAGTARFWWRGWITSVYVDPKFHFTYHGFEWVQPLGATGMHIVFAAIAVSALFIALGLLYRVAAVTFFLCFTYVELIDATTYLNHYYFVSLIAFILIWLPAGNYYALDTHFGWRKEKQFVPRWTIGMLRFQMAIVYIFAGIAKLNADWLLNAIPMKIWLPAKSHLPLIGDLMYETWVHYLFSWFGAAYDLFIAFFLLNSRTRPVAYVFVLVFHIATALFFPGIGMFPYVMIVCSLVFFSGAAHNNFLSRLPFYKETGPLYAERAYRYSRPKLVTLAVAVYVLLQLAVPLRYVFYPDHLFWSEEGYRFSWRVMLMEKSGAAYFTVKDKDNNRSYEVSNGAYLTPLQEKMMSTQPDMILKFAHYLAKEYKKLGVDEPKVYAEVYVALNGQRSRLFVDSSVDLAGEDFRWKHYDWIIPYHKEMTVAK